MATTQQSIDKLNKYNERLELLNKQLAAVNKNTKEYKRLLAEKANVEEKAIKASQQLANAQGRLSSTLPNHKKLIKEAADAQKRYNTNTAQATKVSKGFFSRLKTATGTLLRYSIAYRAINFAGQLFNEIVIESAKRAIRLEKALADVAAVANLSSQEVSRLKDTVFEVAGVTSLTALEVVELQKQLAKLGTSVSDIENLTGPVAILSQALGEEPGGVAATLKKTLNQFQATTEESERFANVLVGAVNETALSLNDLGTALQYVGPLAAQSGVSFEDTASLLGILADNGFRASRAGTGLRNVLLEASKSGKPFAEFLEELSERNLDVAQATELFGVRGASAAIVLANNTEKVKELSDELERSDRLLYANAKQMGNTQGQLDILASAYNKASTQLGDYITKTDLFLTLIAVFDREAAGTAKAYRIISQATDEQAESIDNIISSLREFNNETQGTDRQLNAVSEAFDLLGLSLEGIDKDKFLADFNKELKNTGDLQESLVNIGKTWNNVSIQTATNLREVINILYLQSKSLDEAYIAQEANNESVKRYQAEYNGLLSLTREGINVDKEKAKLTKDIDSEIEALGKASFKAASERDFEQQKIIIKRIALLKEQKEEIGKLGVSEELLSEQRKKADKEAQDRLKTDLASYIERIKETEKAISELPEGVSDKVFTQQVDLLDGFFGGADDIIAEAQKRFGADSPFVKGLTKTLQEAAQDINVTLPQLPTLEIDELFFDEDETEEFINDFKKSLISFEDFKLAEVIAEGLDKAAESISAFNDVALENTKASSEAQLAVIEQRYKTEDDILKSQLDNQLITESQFRQKQLELQKAKTAEENAIDKKVFDAEKKRDRQNATTDYLQSLASIIPNLIVYDKEGDPVKLAVKAAISAGLTTASYGAELAAINQRKFFPKKFAEGGMVSGPSHDQGGVPFTVQGQGGYEMEGGEYIINKRATAMHRDLLERINKSGMTRPQSGKYRFAEGGLVGSPVNESVDYLKAIAEATTSTAIGVSKPVRAYVSDKDLRTNANERRIRDRNDRL